MIVVVLTFLSHWRRAPMQLGLMVVGLALATALWSGVQAINGEARASYARAVEQIGLQDMQALINPAGPILTDRYVMLRRAGWQLSPILEGRWQINGQAVTLIGVDVLSYPGAAPLVDALTRTDDEGATEPLTMLRPPGTLFAHPETLPQLEGVLARRIAVNTLPQGIVFADISLATRLLQRPGVLSRLIVMPEQPMGLVPLSTLAPDLRLQEASGAGGIDPAELTDSFHLNLTAFGLLSFAVGLFIVQGTLALGIEHRRGTIRTLRSLGVSLRMLAAALLIELVALALVAGLLGLVLGYLLAGALMPDVRATLEGIYSAHVATGLSLRLSWVLSGLGMALGGVLLVSVQAFWSLRRVAIHTGATAQSRGRLTTRGLWISGGAGLSLILAGIAVLYLAPSLLAGFVYLGGVMLGSALLLPGALTLVLRLVQRIASGPLLRWSLADTRLQIPGLSLALMALLLAIATNIGVGTMVSSFRLTFLSWIDQRLSADLYVQAQSEEEARAVMAWAHANGMRSLPQHWSETEHAGGILRIYGVVDDPIYRQHWPLLRGQDTVWDELHTDGYVLVNEQLFNREQLKIGATVTLTADWTPIIAGVYADYGNPHGQVIAAAPTLRAHMAQVTLRQVGLAGEAGASISDLAQKLAADLALPADAIAPQNRIRTASVAIFERAFLVTGALNLLTLGVAGFAMLTSFLSQWSQRLPQLAPIWAMGVTRRQLAVLELARSLGLAALTFVFALPLGLVLAWSLLAIINVEAYGWRLPMHLFVADWLKLAALTVLTAAIAAILPALRLLRIAPATLLGVFADER